MLISLLAATALMGASDPDGAISTAPKGTQAVLVGAEAPVGPEVPSVSGQQITPHGLSTDQQIERWVGQRAEARKPFADDSDPWASRDDRKMHSEFSATIGTNDFSAYSAAVSIPVGENARINLSYTRINNGYGYNSGAYDGYSYGPGGFGPGGFGAVGRGYGYGYGAPSIFDRGVVHPGAPVAPVWERGRFDTPERDKTPTAED